jgi:glycine cleavage system H protein
MSLTEGILCSKSHEYIREKDGVFFVGLTDYAIEQLGDIVFLELPDVGAEFEKGEVFATIESVKAASEIYMPITGRILEVNEAVVDNPEILNESPFEKGWLVKVESETAVVDSIDLLEYDDYREDIA